MADESAPIASPDPVGRPGEAIADDERRLWTAFKNRGQVEARATLIVRYLPLARTIARSVYRTANPHYLDFADLSQLAALGLMESIDRFDPQLGVTFAAFSAKRIRGAVLNGLEDQSELHAQSAFRRRLRQERIASLQGEVSNRPNEVFAEMVELALGLAVGLMLEDTSLFQESEPAAPGRVAYSDSGALLVHSQNLRNRIASLPDNERSVIELHYFGGVAFAEIASMLKLTRGRISQIHSSAIRKLREGAKSTRPADLRI